MKARLLKQVAGLDPSLVLEIVPWQDTGQGGDSRWRINATANGKGINLGTGWGPEWDSLEELLSDLEFLPVLSDVQYEQIREALNKFFEDGIYDMPSQQQWNIFEMSFMKAVRNIIEGTE